MQSEIATTFIAEAEDLLGRVRGSVLAELQSPGSSSGPAALKPLVVNLRMAAEEFGFPAIVDDLVLLESELNATPHGIPVPAARAMKMLDLLVRLNSTLADPDLGPVDLDLEFSNPVGESFEFLELGVPDPGRTGSNHFAVLPEEPTLKQEAPPAPAHNEEPEDEFEIDAEMLEVFAMEAEDLLRNIENNLEILEHQPEKTEALWEIRRNAHTLKGAAGIVGLKKPSRLAHRVEDLLDRLAEKNAGSNAHIFTLLRTASECLHRLTAGENSAELNEGIAQLYSGFDGVLSALAGGGSVPDGDPSVLADKEQESLLEFRSPSRNGSPPEFTTLTPTAEPAEQNTEDNNEQESPKGMAARPRSIVRVSLERLDDLVRTVRELVVTRSVLEQRLSDLERQIKELHDSTRRLQSSCAKFEIDFEVSMLGGNGSAVTVPNGSPTSPNEGFDTLEFDQYTEFHQTTRALSETTRDIASINGELDAVSRHLENVFEQQHRLIDEMQERLMRIRMVEFGALTTRLQRSVRVTCDEENKKANVIIENGKIEVDNQTLDGLIEPLMHLLKNAVVHGIEYPETRRLLGKPETGEIRLKLENEETHIVLTVRDDGRGIAVPALIDKAIRGGQLTEEAARGLSDEEAFELIFLPGLTTAEKLNLSAGRGVGMNIVRESIEAQKGTISIESVPQSGTTFTLRVPLPLAVTNVLLVTACRQKYAVPAKYVEHICAVPGSSVVDLSDGREVSVGDQRFSLHYFEDLLGLSLADLAREEISALLIDSGGKQVVIAVEEVLKSEEIVIKSLEKPLDTIKGLAGVAVLGSGELVPILDIPVLLKNYRPPSEPCKMITEEPDELIIFIVDDSPSVRHMTSKVITNAGWKPETARDGMEAVEKLKAARKLPAVILSDIEMPRMDGYEMAVAIKENPKLKDIPVVFISSRSGEKHREKAAAAGVEEYLTKPFGDKELISTVKRLAGI